jgi:hypothetical protein
MGGAMGGAGVRPGSKKIFLPVNRENPDWVKKADYLN